MTYLEERWVLTKAWVPRDRPTEPEPPTPPPPMLVAMGNGFNRPERLFSTVEEDMVKVAEVFSHVTLSPNSTRERTAAVTAGLKVIIEFDYKWDYAGGTSIDARVGRVIDELDKGRDQIAGVHVADRLNSYAQPGSGRPAIDPDIMQGYLAATGGRIHEEAPDIPVFCDVEDHTVTCGRPGQMRCGSAGPMYVYERTDILQMLAATGYVDGLVVADNLATTGTNAWSSEVQAEAWGLLRAALPEPFVLLPRTSRVSFTEDRFPGNIGDAYARVECGVSVPIAMGSNGSQLWGWHIPYFTGQEPNTWLNKDGTTNPLWDQLKAAAMSYESGITTTV
jgi:hypothetical protein